MISRCLCCEEYKREIMKHLFLIACIVERLWKHFANFVGIKFEGLHLEQLIKVWWRVENNNKLRQVYRAIPALIIWELWKRRNTRKHGGDTTLKEMLIHIETAIHQLIRALHTWLKCTTDGATRGNPELSFYGFCIRDHKGDLCYAQAGVLGQTTNVHAEARAILEALRYWVNTVDAEKVLETDSLYD
ncbi:hypothetical protein R3W88_011589 [Solanum pinnatisectum]|uniref:RNase H type-1 domain-containing protein n=1 Tax=Solanum pinnatisectum TaxID=50273 RepID=A0AAV9L6M3_9SOLN|nr:hypothetical protein R3W88_011589 [Solanum pinnatisectum]